MYTLYCWYTLLLKGIPYIYFASKSGYVVNRLDSVFVDSELYVTCNALVFYVVVLVYIYISGMLY